VQVLYELLSNMLVSVLYAGVCVWGQGTCNPWWSNSVVYVVIHSNSLYSRSIWGHSGASDVLLVLEGPVFICLLLMSLRYISTDPWHLKLVLLIWDC